MSLLKHAMTAMDVGNATSWVRMGLRQKQVFDVFGAYFRGADLPKIGNMAVPVTGLSKLESNPWTAAARIGMATGLGLGVWNMLPRSNMLAIPAGIGAGVTATAMTSHIPALQSAPKALRGGIGLVAGSLAYQGLRSTSPSEFQVNT